MDNARTAAVRALDACESRLMEALHASAEAGQSCEVNLLAGRLLTLWETVMATRTAIGADIARDRSR